MPSQTPREFAERAGLIAQPELSSSSSSLELLLDPGLQKSTTSVAAS